MRKISHLNTGFSDPVGIICRNHREQRTHSYRACKQTHSTWDPEKKKKTIWKLPRAYVKEINLLTLKWPPEQQKTVGTFSRDGDMEGRVPCLWPYHTLLMLALAPLWNYPCNMLELVGMLSWEPQPLLQWNHVSQLSGAGPANPHAIYMALLQQVGTHTSHRVCPLSS